MNRSRVALCLSAVFFAASVVVLVRAKEIADEARSLREGEASEEDLGDIFVLTHNPDNGDVLDTWGGFDALNAMMPPDLDQLASDLRLTADQSARIESIVGAANDRIRGLLDTPDSLGRSPRATIDGRWELAGRLLDACPLPRDSVRIEVLPVEFRRWRIKGSDRTYGEEIERLMSSARNEITECLGPEQRQKLERIDTHGLFPVPDGSGEAN